MDFNLIMWPLVIQINLLRIHRSAFTWAVLMFKDPYQTTKPSAKNKCTYSVSAQKGSSLQRRVGDDGRGHWIDGKYKRIAQVPEVYS